MQNEDDQSWLDFMAPRSSPVAMTSDTIENMQFFGIGEDDEVEAIKKITSEAKQNKCRSDLGGKTFEVTFPHLIDSETNTPRTFVLHIPQSILNEKKDQAEAAEAAEAAASSQPPLLKKYPLLICLHGLMGTSWVFALHRSGFIEKANSQNFIVAFGQAKGKQFDEPFREKWSFITCGETFWEIEEPQQDFQYLMDMVSYCCCCCDSKDENLENKVDCKRVYLLGHSNGAIFTSNVAMRFGGSKFAAIVNMCGGFPSPQSNYNKQELLLDISKEPNIPVPMFIISGTNDEYLKSCERAKEEFERVGFKEIKMYVVPGGKHRYYRFLEESVLEFCFSHALK